MHVVNIRTFGAVGDGVKDDEPAFTKAFETLHACTLYIPNGGYRFARQPAMIKKGIVLRGEPYFRTRLIRDYVPIADDEPFIRSGNTTRFESITIESAPGITGKGYALSIVSDDTALADWVVLRDCMIRGDGTNASSWKRGLHASGINRTGSTLGVRDLSIFNCYLMDCDEHTLFAENVINLFMSGGGVFTNTGAVSKVTITGAVGHQSERVTIQCNIAGSLAFEYTSKAQASGVVDSSVSIDANSSHIFCTLGGSPTVTNASSTSLVLVP